MLTPEENALLTQTGPTTPGGDLLRRYWQPIALTEELPEGGAPIPLRIMSENLVLFRDELGRTGLLGIHCSHRAADLSYGRVEDGGLRCLYHGWLYDIDGNCLDQPGEPVGTGLARPFKEKIKHPAYPCLEKGGIIFAYMGPGEPPLFPAYEFMEVPDTHRYVTKYFHECNYLQGNEGNIDPQHLSFLHRFFEEDRRTVNVRGANTTANTYFGQVVAPTLEVEETDFGLRIFSVRGAGPDAQYVRITNYIYPNLGAFPGRASSGYGINWHVPIDDTHHWKFNIVFEREEPLDFERVRSMGYEDMENYRFTRNKANRYLQDREEMQTKTFIGLGRNFQLHDAWATEGEGPIQDRTNEHLGYTDKAIAASRRLLLRAIRDIQEGTEAPHVVRDPAANNFDHLGAYGEVVPNDAPWGSVWQRAAEARAGARTR